MARRLANAVLLTTPTASDQLRAYAESLVLSAAARATVFAVGGRENLAKLQAALPSQLAEADVKSLHGLAQKMGWRLLRSNLLAADFTVVALGGSLTEAKSTAKSSKLLVRAASDFDRLTDDGEMAAYALAAELADIEVARQRLAKLSQKRREELLLSTLDTNDDVLQERLRSVSLGLDVGAEFAFRMTTSLPEHADLRAFASYHDEFRKRTFNKREARPWLFSPTNYFQFVCRLCSIGAPFINHRRVAANELLDKRGSVGEDVIRALECADAEDCVTALGWNIFGFAVHAGELPFTALTQPDLPGHQLYCHCAACETFRVEHALRRVVAVAPFDSLPADTRERVKQVMRLKRVKPFLPILEAWASFTSASLEPESKPKDTNVSTTPHLDNAEAWLATVRATKTTAGLKKLQAQLATMENTDLTDEDTERWEEIIRCVTNHRDTFRHSTQQHAVLNSMIDELSST